MILIIIIITMMMIIITQRDQPFKSGHCRAANLTSDRYVVFLE